MKNCWVLALLFTNVCLMNAIQKDTFFPYGLSEGDSVLQDGDDEVSQALKTKKPLQFYDVQFNILYVSTNGFLSLQPPPEEIQYLRNMFPLSFSAIVPFLTDISSGPGKGSVFYRAEESSDVLNRASEMVQQGFAGSAFKSSHTVIATWDNVVCEEEGLQLPFTYCVTSFQVVLACNKSDTYALFLYPEDEQKLSNISYNHTNMSKRQAKPQAGFNRGDTSSTEELFYSLFGSNETSENLYKAGNTGVNGLWIFHIGSSRLPFRKVVPASVPKSDSVGFGSLHSNTDEDFYISVEKNMPADKPTFKDQMDIPASLAQKSLKEATSNNVTKMCGLHLKFCSYDGYCTDYPTGPCCHCRSGYYGNGRQCLPMGISQPLSGKLSGLVSAGDTKVQLNNVDIHGFAVVGEGRVYISVSPVPSQAGWALMAVSPLVSTFGWLLALELQNHLNGYSITGAEFSHQAELVFSPQGQRVTIIQEAEGLDSFNHLNFDIRINGDLPSIPDGAKVHILPFEETYQYNQSVVTSSSLREYTVVSENGGSETFSYMLQQNTSFRSCEHSPWTVPDFQQLNVEHLMVTFTEGTTLRYAITNKVGPVGGELPALFEVNPCTTGKHSCDPMALCLPGDGTHYHCQCAMGFLGDGRNCYDVDECAEGLSSCGPHSQCVNMPGGHHCNCHSGYEFDADLHVCVDIDECFLQPCHAFASCFNTRGSFHCQCWPEYEGDGFLCQPPQKARPPLTVCQQHRESLQESLSIYPSLEAFIPQCDEKGQYKPLQCLGSTGHCWCVDGRGQERVGTRTMPGTAHANCDQPAALLPRAETVCERWRLSLLTHYNGQPSPRDYMPLCDAHGNFLPVQCYGNSTFCWCVDLQGIEIVGTRSYHDVKPPCISGDPAPLHNALMYPVISSSPSGPAIVYTQASQIGVIPLDETEPVQEKSTVLLALKDSIVLGIDYDCQENMLYWTDFGRHNINRALLEFGSEPEAVISQGLVQPEGLAVDAVHRKLFWVDSGKDRIETSDLDGRNRTVLIDSDLVNPRAIVVDSKSGTLYWTDWNRDAPKIESSSVEGHKRKVLVQEGLVLPNALTLDFDTDHLCWADAGTKKLECISPDGTERRVFKDALNYPFSLAVYDRHFYYTDWERDGIMVIDQSTGENTAYLPIQQSHLYGITVIPSRCL
ncbi:nidogen-2 isoform X2 [Puntigrus tetrazona]|uniref:nidogen-2 isoform X2 n=1 Tax=Puntigrus tetrazona TaxID=1606681 RepID=UPI001C8964E7|nr:nidogen-2 isoform X2 [Puntigrus tetrazona]